LKISQTRRKRRRRRHDNTDLYMKRNIAVKEKSHSYEKKENADLCVENI
jgi:hypothetical protein